MIIAAPAWNIFRVTIYGKKLPTRLVHNTTDKYRLHKISGLKRRLTNSFYSILNEQQYILEVEKLVKLKQL